MAGPSQATRVTWLQGQAGAPLLMEKCKLRSITTRAWENPEGAGALQLHLWDTASLPPSISSPPRTGPFMWLFA